MTTDNRPLWRQITDTLTNEISTSIAPGARLPTEARLAARFGVNRHTVRRALAALAEAGLVQSRRGAGVFATARPVEYPLTRRTRFRAAMSATGRIPGRRVLMVQKAPATATEAEALALPVGAPVLQVEGITLTDGQAIGHFRSAFPVSRLPGLEAAFARGLGVTDALAGCGVADYTRAWTRLSARQADAILAGHLQMRAGGPVLRSESLNCDDTGQPVEYGVTHFAGERVTLTVAPQ